MNKMTCIYCDNVITSEDEKHFISDCCCRGMCNECFNRGVGTDEQVQVNYFDDEETEIKPEYQDSTYLCFDCADIWAIKNN